MKRFFQRCSLGLTLLCLTAVSAEQNYCVFSNEFIENNLKEYSETEKELIQKDYKIVESICLPNCKNLKKPIYFATAGAPGARKSTILESFLREKDLLPFVAYLDPDQRAMRYMAHTFQNLSINAFNLAQKDNETLKKDAYNQWRGGSNYITVSLLVKAFQNRMNIAHGTTLTGGHIPNFLPQLKELGYDLVLLLCFTEDEDRFKAIEHRIKNQGIYQSTVEDAVNKGLFFPQRMRHYFKNADTLYLYWSDSFPSAERLAAVLDEGRLNIQDDEAYELIIDKYERDRETIAQKQEKTLPTWQECIEEYTSRFSSE